MPNSDIGHSVSQMNWDESKNRGFNQFERVKGSLKEIFGKKNSNLVKGIQRWSR